MYATLNPEGDIVISRFTHETLGSPDSYLLLFDRERQVIGLRPARLSIERNAYPAKDRGRHGGKRIRGYRLCREFGITVPETVRFHHCQLDNSGVLILDLDDTRPVRQRSKLRETAKFGTDESGERYRIDERGNRHYTY